MGGRVTPLVEARGLGKSYVDGPSVVRVLADLDLTVMPGERLAVVGASGVGKSTLLHLLGALDRPTAGQLLFDGVDLATRSENDLAAFRNREVGFVFQFHHLLGHFTALENVMLPALIAREPLRAARSRAASSSGSPSRAPSCTGPAWSWPTSPQATSIRRPAHRSRRSCSTSTASTARP